jgi:predicted DNA-binding transcriptional regulator YafY
MPRLAADDRLRRLLAMVPWVAAHDGPRIDEVCQRFACSKEELVADLDLLFLCGVYPYTPDLLIDVDIADGRVWIRYADWFRRPLRLTPEEGLALVGAGTALQASPGADPEGPLARALSKLAGVLGVDADETVEVELGAARPELLGVLRRAQADLRQVEIDYYSFGRDGWTKRVIDPWSVFSAAGQWYVRAYCHRVEGERLFRVDRVRDAVVLESGFSPPARSGAGIIFSPRADDPLVVLELEPAARWVRDQYPNEGTDELGGGRLRVRLRISERAWLERLLLRLGPLVRVVEGEPGVGAAAAQRLLARYGHG